MGRKGHGKHKALKDKLGKREVKEWVEWGEGKNKGRGGPLKGEAREENHWVWRWGGRRDGKGQREGLSCLLPAVRCAT